MFPTRVPSRVLSIELRTDRCVASGRPGVSAGRSVGRPGGWRDRDPPAAHTHCPPSKKADPRFHGLAGFTILPIGCGGARAGCASSVHCYSKAVGPSEQYGDFTAELLVSLRVQQYSTVQLYSGVRGEPRADPTSHYRARAAPHLTSAATDKRAALLSHRWRGGNTSLHSSL